jgi:2-polyprenyl-3-methyl-5-hydroxy-6-metoxy-1,4-benzoquinol methylase
MSSIKDERGYNQGFQDSLALRIRTERRCDEILKEMDLSRPARILELGCGTGEMANYLATKTNNEVIGTDLSPSFIKTASDRFSKNNLHFQVLDLNSEDLSSQIQGEFDYIVGNGILHHLYNNLDKMLFRFQDILKPQGKLLFWEPNIYNPYVFLIFSFPVLRKLAHLEPDEMAFSKTFIKKKLINSGYHPISVKCKDFLLPNVPDKLINPIIKIGAQLEKFKISSWSAQSLFISATKKK